MEEKRPQAGEECIQSCRCWAFLMNHLRVMTERLTQCTPEWLPELQFTDHIICDLGEPEGVIKS